MRAASPLPPPRCRPACRRVHAARRWLSLAVCGLYPPGFRECSRRHLVGCAGGPDSVRCPRGRGARVGGQLTSTVGPGPSLRPGRCLCAWVRVCSGGSHLHGLSPPLPPYAFARTMCAWGVGGCSAQFFVTGRPVMLAIIVGRRPVFLASAEYPSPLGLVQAPRLSGYCRMLCIDSLPLLY